jgi:hypothetical protein
VQVEYEVGAAWVDPLVQWKQVYTVRQYRDKAAELQARLFIEEKLRQHNKVCLLSYRGLVTPRQQVLALFSHGLGNSLTRSGFILRRCGQFCDSKVQSPAHCHYWRQVLDYFS